MVRRTPKDDNPPENASFKPCPERRSFNASVRGGRAGVCTNSFLEKDVVQSPLWLAELNVISRRIGAVGSNHPLRIYRCIDDGDEEGG